VGSDDRRELLGGRYALGEVLGSGGIAIVHAARDTKLGRAVAIKILRPAFDDSPEAIERLQREARVSAAVGHPNVCEVSDIGERADGTPYLVMERLHGETLHERIERRPLLGVDDALDIASQVLSALAIVHEMGIVHRDLKPANLFLSRVRGRRPLVKVLDFGAARLQTDDDAGVPDTMLTMTGAIVGTPTYMAPEQASGIRELDGRTDLYACGAILYEALTGQRPYQAPNFYALMHQIATTRPKPLRERRPEIPPWFAGVIEKAMNPDRNLRQQTADELLRDLAQGEELARRAPRDGETRKVDTVEVETHAFRESESRPPRRSPSGPPPRTTDRAAPQPPPRARKTDPPARTERRPSERPEPPRPGDTITKIIR